MENNTTIGTLLKEQRQKKNISLEEVAQKTKINLNILKALEEDDFNNLPNKTYVKGFVKNYAKTIGVDINEASSALENTYSVKYGHFPEESPNQKQLGALQSDDPQESESEEIKETIISIIQGFMNKKVIYGCCVLIVLFLIGKGVVNFFSQLNFESKKLTDKKKVETPIKSSSENIFEMKAAQKFREDDSKSSSELKNEGKKSDETKILAKTQEEKSPTEVKEKPEVIKAKTQEDKKEEKEEEKEEVVKIEIPAGKLPYKNFYPAPQKMYSLNEESPLLSDASILPPNIKAATTDGKQAVYIVATDGDTWISYKTDQDKIKRFVLKQGRRVLITGETILLFMGNFNVAKVFLNNKLVEANTSTGVKSLIFPQSEATNFELPLFPSHKGVLYSASEYKENMVAEPTESN